LAVAVFAGGTLLALLADCGSEGCTVSCPIPYGFATFNLSCSATDLTNVAVSGPCATDDASPSYYVAGQSIEINSPTPGVCHVELTFATGFTYSTDVNFMSQTAPNPPVCCPLLTAPTQTSFTVNNPSTTCVDAGAVSDAPTDAPSDTAAQAEADAPTDAPSEAVVDAQVDAGADG
jgi:hypothetical protein